MIITLENSFHNTSYRVRITEKELALSPYYGGIWGVIQVAAADETNRRIYGPARRRERRVERALCGIEDCACGTVR